MKELDINLWNRKEHFEHFSKFEDPYFSVVVDVDVTSIYQHAKRNNISFFVLYLHACIKAINSIENFKYRIYDDKVIIHDTIHVSATIARKDNTFGCSFIHFSADFNKFYESFKSEKKRILSTTDLFPAQNTLDCIYCSALPWFNFSGHKEPHLGVVKESVPKFAFGKFIEKDNKLMMPVAIAVHHGLIDGYHVGLFTKLFQENLYNF